MTKSDELVKRLWLHDCEGITREAADRIEKLEWEHHCKTAEAKLAECEARLSEAAEALGEAIYLLDPNDEDVAKRTGLHRIVKTYAELKGQDGR